MSDLLHPAIERQRPPEPDPRQDWPASRRAPQATPFLVLQVGPADNGQEPRAAAPGFASVRLVDLDSGPGWGPFRRFFGRAQLAVTIHNFGDAPVVFGLARFRSAAMLGLNFRLGGPSGALPFTLEPNGASIELRFPQLFHAGPLMRRGSIWVEVEDLLADRLPTPRPAADRRMATIPFRIWF